MEQCVHNPIACVTTPWGSMSLLATEMHGQVVDEFIHVDLAIDIIKHVDLTVDIIKHVFKTNINSECGVPPAGMK